MKINLAAIPDRTDRLPVSHGLRLYHLDNLPAKRARQFKAIVEE